MLRIYSGMAHIFLLETKEHELNDEIRGTRKGTVEKVTILMEYGYSSLRIYLDSAVLCAGKSTQPRTPLFF